MPIRQSSEAQRKAVQKHDKEIVDKVTVRLPKGSKELIRSTGQTVNSFVIDAVKEKLSRVKNADPSIGSFSADEKQAPVLESFFTDEVPEIERVPAEEIP